MSDAFLYTHVQPGRTNVGTRADIDLRPYLKYGFPCVDFSRNTSANRWLCQEIYPNWTKSVQNRRTFYLSWKWEGVETGWRWLRIGTDGGHLWIRWWTFGFHKVRGISWLAAEPVRFSRRTLLHGVNKDKTWLTPFWLAWKWQFHYVEYCRTDGAICQEVLKAWA